MEVCGWLVGEDVAAYRVINGWGHPRTWSRKETQVRADSLGEFAQRIVKVREKFNGSTDDKERRRLQESVGVCTAMTSPTWTGSIPETLAAAWSLQRGDRQTCARLMVPLMEDVSDEKGFLGHLRDEIAADIDKRMLEAFTSRDYGEALRLAKLLATPCFDGFTHQDRAKGLAATLPQRAEDFKSLVLVSPAAWQALKKQYSRPRQIDFLARRLRLIHATQQSTPGGIDYCDTQYLSANAAEFFADEGEEAINPYCELLRLNLSGAEMLPLVPYLESPDYILAYDLYRFLPMGPFRLHKVSWVVGTVFNTVSQEEIVDLTILEGPSAEARKRQLDRVRKWCADHAASTHADHLARTVQQAKEWQDVKSAFWGLLELDEGRAVRLIVPRCDSDPAQRGELARLLCLLDRKEYLPRARQWMRDTDDEERFWGALLVLKHADPKKPEGLEIVLSRLAEKIELDQNPDPGGNRVHDAEGSVNAAVETLLRIDDPRVRKFFSTYCGAKPYRDFDPSSAALQRLFRAGCETALDRLLDHLGEAAPRIKGATGRPATRGCGG